VNFVEAIGVAARAVLANRLRSALTVLGVVIGVFSVVALVSIGTGARNEVTSTVESLGSNLLLVVPGEFEGGGPPQAPTRSPFRLDDVERLQRRLPAGAAVSGSLTSGGQLEAGSASASASVLGVTASFPETVNRPVATGQFLTEPDVTAGRRVAVVGAPVAEELFGGGRAVAQRLSVGGVRFRVIGALESQGSTLGVTTGDSVYIPITAAQRLFNTRRVDTMFIKAPNRDSLDDVAAQARQVLSADFDRETFSVVTQDELLGVVGEILDILTFVLAAIAGISLLVGGIGVSNIMLVSVSERTSEIGLRKALGARTRDITRQFLVESVLLCGFGGLVGLAGGIAAAEIAAQLSPIPAAVTWWSVSLAFGVSVGVGIVFGVFPARRAGRLDPVAALRAE
jgi:putative ABC transport system permease protein